jgi:hypothetical protein
MKAIRLVRLFCVFVFTAALAVFSSGCATHDEHSFNDDFNQTLPVAPIYSIENINDNHFTVTVRQSKSLMTEQRITFVKRAASVVIETEAKRRGWQNWQHEYIMEIDQGWMHIVKADVVRKNAVEMKTTAPTNQP